MIRTVLAAFFVASFGLPALAQEKSAEDLKKRILEKVRARLAAERKAFLKRVEKIIDEEYARGKPVPPVAAKPEPGAKGKLSELERKLRALEEQRDILRTQVEREKRLARDEGVKKEAKEKGPHNAQQAGEMFRTGLRFHEAQKFDQSIKFFKMIYYRYPQTQIGFISAYNVSCGYALAGKKPEALDWLELSIEKGYNDFEHMRQDPDLDGLRKEKRYKRLLTDR